MSFDKLNRSNNFRLHSLLNIYVEVQTVACLHHPNGWIAEAWRPKYKNTHVLLTRFEIDDDFVDAYIMLKMHDVQF